MAYNLQPLITILEQILNPEQTRWIFDHNKPQLQSLLEKAQSLQQMVENSSPLIKLGSLERRIRKATHKAEDMIESHMVNQILSNPGGVRFTYFTPNLHHVMQQLDSATEQVVKLIESKGASSSSSASFLHDLRPDVQRATQEVESLKLAEVEVDGKKIPTGSSSSNNNLVGVDEDLMQLKDRLTNMQRKLEIIPIVGMGGIGKSTLARSLYEDSLIVEHFEYRGWAVISQEYNIRTILLNLLRGPNGKFSNELNGLEVSKLKEILYKRLFGRRYLIALDDIWSNKFWNDMRPYFPSNNNRSRIVITTRESSVASDANWSMLHQVQFLDASKSWDLLRQIVFGEEICPHVLQEIGKKIASGCYGLPLTIRVIGGVLSKVEKSRDVWEQIASDVKAAAVVKSDEQLSNVLSLSYDHLPIHLKPCFLYMGINEEDYVVKGSNLVDIWIAEGLVKSNGADESLEEEGENYLKSLVERNLFLVARKKSNGKPMSYSIHDLLRDLCIRKAKEEKFMNIVYSPDDVSFSSERRVSISPTYEMEDVYVSPLLMPLARSFLTDLDEFSFPLFSALGLVRVLELGFMVFNEFPEEILQLVNLRHLLFNCTSDFPIGISRLWNLQTLFCKCMQRSFPSDMWEISELRHLRLNSIIEIEEGYKFKFVHKKLQVIYFVRLTLSLITSGFFAVIPNIKNLGIFYIDSPSIEIDLSHLDKLEILRCQSELSEDGSSFLPKLRLPPNLRKLTLSHCVIYGSFLTTLCALPKLEVLKVIGCVFERKEADEEEEWKATEEDEFHSLQYLHLESLNLVRWTADETNFPRLRHLIISNCLELEEIPSAIGDIPTFQQIEIWGCSDSVVASAREIQKVQQEDCDNYDLKVDIY